ncbi:hypothetical protein Q670_03305 [Alcanivorax sp. P2S70]|uniref:class I SAM-dependent methyltransferase n=1 Tax=Alcanivorax sp. P2S70 TaxID=1397527 RepID=UPI0003B46059|nr:class I SAM-dependent methyltransferase [Alcanivorax sp. P2S70]ERP89425.1 hypothetical protein Q670_03305 [Alcanivorax sp. P2S70]
MPNSWLHLDANQDTHALDHTLTSSDPFAARDRGWVEQMRPFVRELSQPGDRVLDPFAGFASTLVAACQEGRQGVGIEIEAGRLHTARQRLDDLGLGHATLIHGDCETALANMEPVDLVLTSLPYFGCGMESAHPGQLYGAGSYAHFLQKVRGILKALKPIIKPGGYIVVGAENLQLDGLWVPQAWDVARLLAERFRFIEERVIVYDRPHTDSTSPHSNRAHEYMLVAQNSARVCDRDAAMSLLKLLQADFPQAMVIGSFARWLKGEAVTPSDVDLLLPNDSHILQPLTQWLESRGFQLTRWGAPLQATMTTQAMAGANYLRAERLAATGSTLTLDLAFHADPQVYPQLAGKAETRQGIICISEPADLG